MFRHLNTGGNLIGAAILMGTVILGAAYNEIKTAVKETVTIDA